MSYDRNDLVGTSLANLSGALGTVAGLSVTALVSQSDTSIVVRQFGPGMPPGGVEVDRVSHPRRNHAEPDVLVLAAWLARVVGQMDRAGWEQISSS